MRALGIVEAEVVTETDPGVCAILICLQIHLLIFHCPPQPLDEQVVVIAPFPIHADSDSVLLQEPGEGSTGKLGSMVGVEYLGPTLPKSIVFPALPPLKAKKLNGKKQSPE